MTMLDGDIATAENAETAKPSPTNKVQLVGRLSKPVIIKELPSGDLLGTWRLVVARPRLAEPSEPAADGAGNGNPAALDAAPPRRRQTHDTIDCVSFDLDLIGRLSDVEPGALLDVRGCLRRRFSRGLPGGQSRYEVEASTVVVYPVPGAVAKTGAAKPSDQPAPIGQVTAVG